MSTAERGWDRIGRLELTDASSRRGTALPAPGIRTEAPLNTSKVKYHSSKEAPAAEDEPGHLLSPVIRDQDTHWESSWDARVAKGFATAHILP